MGRRVQHPRLIEKFEQHVAEHGCRDGDVLRCIIAARMWQFSWIWEASVARNPRLTCPNDPGHPLLYKTDSGFECAECHIPVTVVESRPDKTNVEVR